MIYFIAETEFKSGRVKIGRSNNLKNRIDSLIHGSPVVLSLLVSIEGDKKEEKIIHQRFQKYHIKGEWFSLEEEVASYIFDLVVSQGHLKEENRFWFYDFIGMKNHDHQFYLQGKKDSLEWHRFFNIEQREVPKSLNGKYKWSRTTFIRGDYKPKNSRPLPDQIRSMLPLTGDEILEIVIQEQPEKARPDAYIRQFIRLSLKNQSIKILET